MRGRERTNLAPRRRPVRPERRREAAGPGPQGLRPRRGDGRRSRFLRIAVLAAVLLLVVLVSVATPDDVIRFSNGRSVTGRIVAESATEVTIRLAGGGNLTVARALIEEILRDVDPTAPDVPGEVEAVLRSERFFLWSGDRRLGVRTLTSRRLRGGDLQFEEESVFLKADGSEDVRVRTVERSGPDLAPREVLYRETSGAGAFLLQGQVRGSMLEIALSLPGEKKSLSLRLPEGVRLPLGAREAALRAPDGLAEPFEAPVFDPRDQNFSRHRYALLGERRADFEGAAVQVRVLSRRRGERVPEEIWIDTAGRCLTEEVNGPPVVAVLSSRERVEAFLSGRTVAPSGDEVRARPEFVLPEAGFRVTRPTLSWTFEAPPAGSRRILSMENLRYFAWADFLMVPGVPEGGLLPALAVEMEKRFAASSEDFRKLGEGSLQVDGVPAVRMVVKSRNKGEDLRSLLVGFVRGERTFYVAIACPEAEFDRALPEFEAIVTGIRFIR
jgi:hypothetical protein